VDHNGQRRIDHTVSMLAERTAQAGAGRRCSAWCAIIADAACVRTLPRLWSKSLVRSVKQSKGYIWVYSEVGRGTTFKVYFPQVHAGVESEPAPVEEIETRGTETILLVEDEAALRAATGEFLESKGYHVLPAGDGIEALKISATHNGEISLLLTDSVMPGLTGTELARQIAVERPAIQVVYMSGYSDNAATTQGLDPSTAYFQKPFSLVMLATTARRLLDKIKPRASSPKSVSL